MSNSFSELQFRFIYTAVFYKINDKFQVCQTNYFCFFFHLKCSFGIFNTLRGTHHSELWQENVAPDCAGSINKVSKVAMKRYISSVDIRMSTECTNTQSLATFVCTHTHTRNKIFQNETQNKKTIDHTRTKKKKVLFL